MMNWSFTGLPSGSIAAPIVGLSIFLRRWLCLAMILTIAFLPYVGSTFNCISGMISQHNIKSGSLALRKISSSLQLVKGDLGLKIQGVYSIL
jgi:hypothetical protein